MSTQLITITPFKTPLFSTQPKEISDKIGTWLNHSDLAAVISTSRSMMIDYSRNSIWVHKAAKLNVSPSDSLSITVLKSIAFRYNPQNSQIYLQVSQTIRARVANSVAILNMWAPTLEHNISLQSVRTLIGDGSSALVPFDAVVSAPHVLMETHKEYLPLVHEIIIGEAVKGKISKSLIEALERTIRENSLMYAYYRAEFHKPNHDQESASCVLVERLLRMGFISEKDRGKLLSYAITMKSTMAAMVVLKSGSISGPDTFDAVHDCSEVTHDLLYRNRPRYRTMALEGFETGQFITPLIIELFRAHLKDMCPNATLILRNRSFSSFKYFLTPELINALTDQAPLSKAQRAELLLAAVSKDQLENVKAIIANGKISKADFEKALVKATAGNQCEIAQVLMAHGKFLQISPFKKRLAMMALKTINSVLSVGKGLLS